MSTIPTFPEHGAPVVSITDDTFSAEVMQADLPVLVDFSAEWCAPCHTMHDVLTDLAHDLQGRLRIVTVDVDQNPHYAARLGVRGMPSLFLFQGGVIIGHQSGAAPKAALRRWIDEVLARD
jgi:thioredoxin 1